MRRLDFEEQTNKKRAYLLSFVIHGLLVSYIAYAGIQMIDDFGTVEIEFVNAAPPKGVQADKFKEANSTINAAAQFKPTITPPKSPIKKSKAKKSKVSKATDVLKSDVLVKKDKPKKKKQKTKTKLAALDEESKAMDDELEKDLEELEKELKPMPVVKAKTKESSPKKDPKLEVSDKNLDGEDQQDTPEKTASYGKSTVVRSHLELTPIAGNPKPRYPTDAARKRYQPIVIIDYFVKPDGSVGDIKFVKPAEMGSVNQSVFEAVKDWKFRKGKTGYFRQDIAFRLSGAAKVIPARLRRTK